MICSSIDRDLIDCSSDRLHRLYHDRSLRATPLRQSAIRALDPLKLRTANICNPLDIAPCCAYDCIMTNNPSHPDLITAMTAMRDLATYIAASADRKLADLTTYPNFYCAFLDDDSDYLPAALDMMRDLMTALTDDDPDDAATALLDRIRRDDFMITEPTTRYSDLPLDAPHDLPIIDPYDD